MFRLLKRPSGPFPLHSWKFEKYVTHESLVYLIPEVEVEGYVRPQRVCFFSRFAHKYSVGYRF